MKQWTAIIVLAALVVGHYTGVAKWYRRGPCEGKVVGGVQIGTACVSCEWWYRMNCGGICFWDNTMTRKVPLALRFDLDVKFPFRIQHAE